jgi:hypothetical protein
MCLCLVGLDCFLAYYFTSNPVNVYSMAHVHHYTPHAITTSFMNFHILLCKVLLLSQMVIHVLL